MSNPAAMVLPAGLDLTIVPDRWFELVDYALHVRKTMYRRYARPSSSRRPSWDSDPASGIAVVVFGGS